MAPDPIHPGMADKKLNPDDKPTEEMVCMRLTLAHHIDNKGTMAEDHAGTGGPESLGG